MSDTPTAGSPFTLKPDGRVSTNWQTLGAIIVGTAIIVGGLVSLKADMATALTKAGSAADDAKQALTIGRDIKEELQRIRWQMGLDTTLASPSGKPVTRNNP